MKKLFLAAAVALIAGGITSCKKSGEETKNEPQQSETSVSDNGSKTTVTDTNADATAGDPSGVDLVIDRINTCTQKLTKISNTEDIINIMGEFGGLASDPQLTDTQKNHILTDNDKARLIQALSKMSDELIIQGIKVGMITKNQEAQTRSEFTFEQDINKAVKLGDFL